MQIKSKQFANQGAETNLKTKKKYVERNEGKSKKEVEAD
jgi:hypothetical protein